MSHGTFQKCVGQLFLSAVMYKLPAIIAGLNIFLAIIAFSKLIQDHEQFQSISYLRFTCAILVSSFLAIFAYRKKSIVLSGAFFGFFFAFIMFFVNVIVGVSLILCYLCTNKATRYRGEIKAKFEVEFKTGGQRNWVQIVSNLGIANLFVLSQALFYRIGEFQIDFHPHSGLLTNSSQVYYRSWLLIGALASISCAVGDTLSSELGPVWSEEEPLLILNLKPVPKGTNGGVTIAGLLASLIGGSVVGLGAWLFQSIFATLEPGITSPFIKHWISPQWPILAFCLYSSLFGSILDSILGALFQYTGYDRLKKKVLEVPPSEDDLKRFDKNGDSVVEHITGKYWLDNHDVNCLAILITGLFTPFFASLFWPSGVSI